MYKLSNVIEGESWYAKVFDAVPDYNESQSPGTGRYQWEINVAVEQEVYDAFKEAGFNAGMRLNTGGHVKNDYSQGKPVITFMRYALLKDGSNNSAPIVVDSEQQPFTDRIENRSKIKVQWSEATYGKTTKYKRPILEVGKIVQLAKSSDSNEITIDEALF